ncbi:MAG TPA: NUDIX domain-containing protein [Lacibacter sp.]|nr:NUDIX domain-containing protein [Lacibacter sp.]
MSRYPNESKILLAVDCIIFGFDGNRLKILLVQRALEPEIGQWSLMGGFVKDNETIQQAAQRVLLTRTGLSNVYLEELSTFSDPARDPVERTVSVAFFALIDINKYKKQITDDFHAEWFDINKHPKLIFDHKQMVEKAKARLRYKAAFHPILFELLPSKFTLPQLKNLYEEVYDIEMDNRNFSRKILSMNLLEKLNEKDKENSKRGAWYYKMNSKKYKANFHAVATIIPNPDIYYS